MFIWEGFVEKVTLSKDLQEVKPVTWTERRAVPVRRSWAWSVPAVLEEQQEVRWQRWRR